MADDEQPTEGVIERERQRWAAMSTEEEAWWRTRMRVPELEPPDYIAAADVYEAQSVYDFRLHTRLAAPGGRLPRGWSVPDWWSIRYVDTGGKPPWWSDYVDA